MPTIEETRALLVEKLKELFQLDQPDLDFGFYRIMHLREKEVSRFIETDLMETVQKSLAVQTEGKLEKLQHKYEFERTQAEKYGAPEPDAVESVKKAKIEWENARDRTRLEKDVYENLIRFFERYYDNGDFLSLRYCARETPGRSMPYAIPYSGEEVKLFWANSDQYYIKTTENFSNFSFDLSKCSLPLFDNQEEQEELPTLRVHFRVVDATEETQNNNKTTDDKKRFFIIHRKAPVLFNEKNELTVQFEYRTDSDRGKEKEASWRDAKIAETVETVRVELEKLKKAKNVDKDRVSLYLRFLMKLAPTEKNKERTILERYLKQYTERNTSDYFIHKDLKGFLLRELDFYIKNEMMSLDNIRNADAPYVETYLNQLKAFREVGEKLIEFLAQLENYQKKLWLKKKFVVETNYCVTLDRIPDDFYEEIAANNEQREEWVTLFAIDEIQATSGTLLDSGSHAYSVPLKREFVAENPHLLLDTKFFSQDFKDRLLAALSTNGNFDEQCNGLLIHSENFQALNLLKTRYKEQVKCIYIDPPYNTGNDGFVYKDGYARSSWISMLYDRLHQAKKEMSEDSVLFLSIDDHELRTILMLCDNIFGESNFIAQIIWRKRSTPPNDKIIGAAHEYILAYAKNIDNVALNLRARTEEQDARYKNPDNHPKGPWTSGDLMANVKGGRYVASLYYPIINPKTGEEHYPSSNGNWRFNQQKVTELLINNEIHFGDDELGRPKLKRFLCDVKDGISYTTLWDFVPLNARGSAEMSMILGNMTIFDNPKPMGVISELCRLGAFKNTYILDYFAGSGTTGHAVINLNREDGGNRKYILVEMGDYFDTVLKPRIEKVVYSSEWKDGKPTARNKGISQCFKYIRLESYEDTLNNIEFDTNPERDQFLASNPELRENYFLRYMLEAETDGSVSLMNGERFADPMNYRMIIRKPGSAECTEQPIDLIETFNYLIGLCPTYIDTPVRFDATFKRKKEPELPKDYVGKLLIERKLKRSATGKWQFRKIEGTILDKPGGSLKMVLVIWRNLTDNPEEDNVVLNAWFEMMNYSETASEYDFIYVNGDNNLMNLCDEEKEWKVKLIEEEFRARLWG